MLTVDCAEIVGANYVMVILHGDHKKV